MASYDFLTLASTGTVPTQVFLTLDTLTFGGSIRAADLTITTLNGATTISYTNPATPTVTVSLKLIGSTAASGFLNTQIAPANFIFSDGSKLMIGDGTTSTASDSMNNTLVGTEYNDYMDGAGGIDTVSYATAAYGVTVDLSTTVGTTDGAAGIDKLLNMDNIIGSAYNDVLIGLATVGSTIDGGFGADIMKGGTGNDTFYVTAGDTVTDSGGTADTIITSVDYYTLPTNIENLVLVSGTYATGNSAANTMTGNTGNNTLDGSAGADTLIGGLGNDTYIVDNVGDVVSELFSQGTDLMLKTCNWPMVRRRSMARVMRWIISFMPIKAIM
jgi:Ca2+-binding RTX toxin-like protein